MPSFIVGGTEGTPGRGSGKGICMGKNFVMSFCNTSSFIYSKASQATKHSSLVN